MCKQKNTRNVKNHLSNIYHQQGGFSLVMVMMIMVVIALLVIAGAQVSNTEMRISTNNADQKYAKGLAEKALLEAEKEITSIVYAVPASGSSTIAVVKEDDLTGAGKFESGKCTSGLCGVGATNSKSTATSALALWEGEGFKDYGKEVDISGAAEKPRYIVEYLGVTDIDGQENLRVFRVTARAVGQNPNTVSTLQTVVVAPAKDS